MATETRPENIGEIRAASTASGGTALSTTVARIVLPLGTRSVALIPRNASGAAVCRFNFNPYLMVLKTADSLATAPTDYSDNAQDGSTSTDVTLSSLNTLANGDALYIGAHVPFSGVVVDVDGANGDASVLTVEYWNGSAWTNITATDGTASGGATFAIDGSVTWTVPSAWERGGPRNGSGYELLSNRYWTRWTVSAALDAAVTLNSMIGISRSTDYAELPFGTTYEKSIVVGHGGWSSVNALTDAGTGNLVVNCETRHDGRFTA